MSKQEQVQEWRVTKMPVRLRVWFRVYAVSNGITIPEALEEARQALEEKLSTAGKK